MKVRGNWTRPAWVDNRKIKLRKALESIKEVNSMKAKQDSDTKTPVPNFPPVIASVTVNFHGMSGPPPNGQPLISIVPSVNAETMQPHFTPKNSLQILSDAVSQMVKQCDVKLSAQEPASKVVVATTIPQGLKMN